jgi:hypothetical protein
VVTNAPQAGTWFAGPVGPAGGSAGAAPVAGTPTPQGAAVTTTMEPMPPGGFDALLRSPNRVVIESNIFGFHSSDSIAGGELRNAFRNGTWSTDPHLRRFVIR